MAPPGWSRPRRLVLFLLPALVALVVMACGADGPETAQEVGDGGDATSTTDPATDEGDSGTSPPTTEAAPTTTTEPVVDPVVFDGDFSASVAPVLAEKCAACHAPGGPGTAHWELASVADAADNHQALLEVIEDGFMPPWPAGGDSPAFVGDRSLRSDQFQAIVDWAAAGGEIDVDPATPIEPAVEIVGLADPDLILAAPEAYTGSLNTTDDYRCQIYDPELTDGGWITAYEFIPDQTEVVHHAIGYVVPADRRERALGRDGEDGRPGWPCFGSSGLGGGELFLGWAPGQDPTEFPDGTGLRIEPGAFIVVQIHYHFETEAPTDRSTLALEVEDGPGLEEVEVATLLAPAEIPCRADEDGPLCDRDAAMAAARQKYGPEGVLADGILALCRADVEDFAAMTDGLASSSCDIPAAFVDAVGEVISVLGHEHEIGSWLRITLNPDTADEQVLLDIPDWDFDWQYNYDPVEQIVIDDDDTIRLECGWDRARRDPRLEPAYVVWADGTNDEMCFATITTRPAT